MPGYQQTFSDELSGDGDYLERYRATVERLRGETAAELGFQPMQPEKLSMIATILASLPLVALMLPEIPVEPLGWEAGVLLLAVWLIAFRVQSLRWNRFQAHWFRKVVVLGDTEPAHPGTSFRFLLHGGLQS